MVLDYGLAVGIGTLGARASTFAESWTLGSFKSPAKWAGQLEKRGWSAEQISEAIKLGKSFPADNLVNKGNAALRFVHPETGRSVVIDTVTREIIHVGGTGFKY